MKNNFLKISLPIVLLVIASFFVASKFIQPAPEKKLVIATGSKSGNYYKTALEYKKLLEINKIEVTLLETAGSVENIELLKNAKADIGFVQNGIIQQDDKSLDFLANIYYEPLWVFYKNDQYKMDYLIQLITKNISIGQEGSGTRDLASKILNDNGINETNSTLYNYNASTAKEKLLNGEIDAMFVVTSHTSEVVKELIENPQINVLSVKRAKAYSRKYSFLEALTLHEGTLDLYKNLPDEQINLLSTSANLVVNKNIPNELVRIFLKQVKTVHNKKSLFAADNQFPNLENTTMNIHEESKKYFKSGDTWLESIFPYWIASNIDRLKILLIPLLTLMFPLLKGFFPLYQWSMRSKIYRWYDTLNKIDKKITSSSSEELILHKERLSHLKIEIQKETKVSLAYMGEYYNLIMHIELVISKIDKSINENSSN